jgi:hypothetical protein
VASWSQFQAAKARLVATQEQMRAASAALKGVQAEFAVGQRSTSNVLDAVQDAISAGVSLISVERERVVSSFALARAIGRLDEQAAAAASTGVRSGPSPVIAQFKSLGALGRASVPWNLASLRPALMAKCDRECDAPREPVVALRRSLDAAPAWRRPPAVAYELRLWTH